MADLGEEAFSSQMKVVATFLRLLEELIGHRKFFNPNSARQFRKAMTFQSFRRSSSRRVFDNFNGAKSPWVRLVALLDLSETRPLSALADSMENRQLELPFYRNTVLTGQFNRPVCTA